MFVKSLPHCIFVIIARCAWSGMAETVIRFDSPARKSADSCSLGNGRLGAMMFGSVERDTTRGQILEPDPSMATATATSL
jgi:hypothetical protein